MLKVTDHEISASQRERPHQKMARIVAAVIFLSLCTAAMLLFAYAYADDDGTSVNGAVRTIWWLWPLVLVIFFMRIQNAVERVLERWFPLDI